MKIINRGVLALIVLLVLAFSSSASFMDVNAALSVPEISDVSVKVEDTLSVWGDSGDVTSGAIVNVYWDIASGSDAWLLGNTTGQSDGNYFLLFDVPETSSGVHYVWVVDTATGVTGRSGAITVSPDLVVDPEEGGRSAFITLYGTGFDDGEHIAV